MWLQRAVIVAAAAVLLALLVAGPWPAVSRGSSAALAQWDPTFSVYLPRADRRPGTAVPVAGWTTGAARALVATDSAVFAGVDDRLAVFGFDERAGPPRFGTVARTPPLPAPVLDLAVAGTRLYVANGPAGLHVYNVSDLRSPRRMTTLDLDGPAESLALWGNHLYVAVGEAGMAVVDVSDQTRPVVVGQLADVGAVGDLAVHDGHVFLAQSANAVRVVAVDDPTDPRSVGFLAEVATGGRAVDIAVGAGGSFVLVADDAAGVRVVDVSDPSAPAEAAFVQLPGGAAGVARSGRHAYVAGEAFGLRVLDVAPPGAARQVAELPVAGGLTVVAAADGAVYGGSPRYSLVAFNATEPTLPVLSGVMPPGQAVRVAVGRDHAHVMTDDPVGLAVVSLDPTEPLYVAGLLPLTASGLTADKVQIAANSRLRFVYLLYYQALQVIDTTAPAGPRKAAIVAMPDGVALALAEGGRYLYVASNGMRVVDLYNPEEPVAVNHLFFAGNGQAIAVSGGRAYQAHREVTSGRPVRLRVFDLGDPAAPAEIGSPIAIGQTAQLLAADGFVYQVDEAFGVRVFDARDPGRMRQVGAYPVEGYARSADLEGDRLVLVEEGYFDRPSRRQRGRHGVHIVDVRRPDNPMPHDFVEFADPIGDVDADGNRLYVAARAHGLVTLDLP